MHPNLVGKYQNYTQADIGRLREAGYDREFTALEVGVRGYVSWLEQNITADRPQSSLGKSHS